MISLKVYVYTVKFPQFHQNKRSHDLSTCYLFSMGGKPPLRGAFSCYKSVSLKIGPINMTDQNVFFINSCPSNFSGDQCQFDVDECQVNNKCKNGGTCANNFGGYICSCISGWDGPECTINKDDCVPSGNTPLCFNGGTCIDKVGKYDCLCPPGKMG